METLDATNIISKNLLKIRYNVATNKKNTLGLLQFHSKGTGNSVLKNSEYGIIKKN